MNTYHDSHESHFLDYILNISVNDYYFELNPDTTFIIGAEILNSSKIKFNGIVVVSKGLVLFRTKKKYVPFREYTLPIFREFYPSYYMKNKNDNQEEI